MYRRSPLSNTAANLPTSSMRRRMFLGAPLAAGTLWLVPAMGHSASFREQRTLLGTRIELQVDHPDARQVREAVDAAWRTMTRLEQMMSRYVPGNALDELHRAAGRSPRAVAPELFAVLQAAQSLHAASRGAFDPTVGSLRDWDFRPGHHQVPAAAAIRTQLPRVGLEHLILDPARRTAWLTQPGTLLDLGGIAKLPILQAGMATLQAGGIRNAMINGGGDVLVSGGSQGEPWHIGIRDPRQPAKTLGTIALRDGIVASSGDYERCFEQAGQRYHHVLNPRTGYPATGPHGAVFVASDTATVNGWGAATLVGGRSFAQQQTALHAGVHSLVVERDRSVWMSPGMAALLRG